MAERVENIMAKGVAEVNHNGESATFDLPEWFRAHESFFDEDALVNHCAEHGILLATLQAGFAQHIIDIRARSKPADLPPEVKGGNTIKQSLLEHFDDGQERVLNTKPEPRTPAEDAVTKAAKLLRGLTDAQKAALKAQGLI